MTKQTDQAAVDRVLAARAARLGPPAGQKTNTGPGAIWNTSGLNGHPGNQPTNVWAQSGLPYSPFNNVASTGQDWRTVVTEYTKKHKENQGG